MSTRFVNVDRRTPLLLVPDMRDWVPEDDLVHFVIAAVEGMDLKRLRVNVRGTGSARSNGLKQNVRSMRAKSRHGHSGRALAREK